MSITSYPTLITTVSTDIEKVGGKNSTIGQIREDKDGKKYVLLKAAGTIINKVIVVNNSGPKKGTNAVSPVMGVNVTGQTVASGSYFWCQNYGPATITTDGSVSLWVKVIADSNGYATPSSETNAFKVGWALGLDDATPEASIFIDPSGAFYILTDANQTASPCVNYSAT